MAKNYSVVFGSGDPRGFTGLSPTFLIFWNLATGASNAPPSIAETASGKSGIYTFTYGTTQPITFLLDAATTSTGSGRYVFGQIDPSDRADEYGNTLTAIGFSTLVYGSSLIALGNSSIALGTTTVAIGTSHLAQGVSMLAQGVSLTSQGVSLFALGTSNIALGTTNVALGTSAVALGTFIGSTASSYGTTAIDPTTLFGHLIRAQELREGNQTYTKSTGVLGLSTRGSSLLREKTISDTSTTTTKT